jgi:hypothetical protein
VLVELIEHLCVLSIFLSSAHAFTRPEADDIRVLVQHPRQRCRVLPPSLDAEGGDIKVKVPGTALQIYRGLSVCSTAYRIAGNDVRLAGRPVGG